MSQDSIRVVCRLRPLNKIEIANDGSECVSYTDKNITIQIGQDDNKYSFAFDKIFGPNTQQVSVYRQVAIPVIKAVISGFNGTIFAYGQTGGGKTWTMEGPSHTDPQFKGLIPRTIEGLFQAISQSQNNLQFLIKCSYIEIYNEKLFDLLDPSKARLDIKQDRQRGIFIQNCSQVCVSSVHEMLNSMDKGSQNRKVAYTGMNERSSRSHSLFIIHIFQKNLQKNSTKQSKLYFVDLAGSQKVSKTGVMGQQLQQAKNINKSLSSLGNVINALTSQKKQHIPYRDSKLTRILQQSLGGNSKTTLIINCSMCTYNNQQTLSTLRFGYRAKSIKNKPKVNQQKSAKQLMILLQAANKTIIQLKAKLSGNIPLSLQQSQQTTNQQIQTNKLINQLKLQLETIKQQEQQRNKQMQLRIKQLLLQISKQKTQYNQHLLQCKNTFKILSNHLNIIYKYIKRSYFDLEYIVSDSIIQIGQQTKQTLQNTFRNIDQFSDYFQKNIKPILESIQQPTQKSSYKQYCPISQKKRMKIALSQPALFHQQSPKDINLHNDDLQMSCIIQQQVIQQNSQSDPVSQQGSLSQLQTFLQSLQTKQSHRFLIQQMNSTMKNLKKQNQQLKKSIDKYDIQKKTLINKIQQNFVEKIMELQQRVDQYKNIINKKDIQITQEIDLKEKIQKNYINQKIICQRFKKIIDNNPTLKSYAQIQQKVRIYAQERQKLFNQLNRLRLQLDQADITIKQKQQHIQSLKNVMKQLQQQLMSTSMNNSRQIQKMYNAQVLGNQIPNVVKTIKGGGLDKKQSTLRKKMQIAEQQKKTQNGKFLPFIKSFFG